MKIIIIGAGELGKILAERLCNTKNDVTIIDSSNEDFARLHERLDVMTLAGRATDISVMQKAGIAHADILLAVSGDEASNILACHIARQFGVRQTVCRLYSFSAFDASAGITPEVYGIAEAFSSPAECTDAIMDAVRRRTILERIRFSNHDATLVTFSVPHKSPLLGMRLREIPRTDLIRNVRLAALVRNRQLIIPSGKTIIYEGDMLYIAGRKEKVEEFVDYADGEREKRHQQIIVAGANRLGVLVGTALLKENQEIRFIERSPERIEAFLNQMPQHVSVVQGDFTNEDVLKEAGIRDCDTFISVEDDDENNLLSCILAKRAGARKVMAVTHKPEYIGIMPALNIIDCSFNTTLVSLNAVFRLMGMSSLRIDSRLIAFHAYLTEFSIKPTSSLIGKHLQDCKLPESTILAMIFRGQDVIVPTGDTQLFVDDVVVAIVTSAVEEKVRPYFG